MRKRIIAGILIIIMVVSSSITVISKERDYTLDETQKNSISILNYLVALTQEINESKNSRLYLENVYSSLFNNTNPGAIDELTQSYLGGLLDTLHEYRMIDIKRERLEYIYEQNQAKALKEAIPNPMGLLSATRSFSPIQMVSSIVYMAVDSAVSYTTAMSEVDLQYLQDGWELDDKEENELHKSRKLAFDYMVDVVREYKLPGELALSEENVEEFVSRKNSSNIDQRIEFLETNIDIYKGFGDYWLTLASSYYENEDYQNCINALRAYESLGTDIFRKDYEYAKALPLVIISAEKVEKESKYISDTEEWLQKIIENTRNSDWALRYFAAQMYVDLYSKTFDKGYLRQSFDIVKDNINYLVDIQKKKNEEYLGEVQILDIPKGTDKEKQKEIKKINEMLKKERKTALPPVYEPFILNCDFLFGLIKELELSQEERKRINGIIHEKDEPIFLNDVVDSMYWISTEEDDYSIGTGLRNTEFSVLFDGDELTIPVFLISDDSTINMSVVGDDGVVFDDWAVKEVNRKDPLDYMSFSVKLYSEKANDYSYNKESRVRVNIIPKNDFAKKAYQFDMEVSTYTESPIPFPPFTTLIDDITFKVVDN